MNNIYVCGDIHGDRRNIKTIINQIQNPTKDDFIIIAGDAGFEYEEYVMGQAKKEAAKFPGIWIVVRGNHDSSYWMRHTNYIDFQEGFANRFIADPDWELITYQGCGYLRQIKYPNIWYTYDWGGIYNLDKYTILFCPGAYSIDKFYRLRNNYPWNPNEQLSPIERQNLYDLVKDYNNDGAPIDFVIGHTFPKKIEPFLNYLFMDGVNQGNVDKQTEEWLDTMAELYENNYAFKQYIGGHFHDTKVLTDKYTILYTDVVNLRDYE